MSRVVVRYRVRPDAAAENERLIREVFEELAERRPGGFSYESSVLSDGVTFVHVVEGDETALRELPAFQRFSSTVGGRCQDAPVQSTARIVGSFEGRAS
ncbi:hypothetical protein HZF07_02535 [Nocardioides sp. CGMCC 1.13656]|uniref:hypothetical protein n=1 Tax=Nocardioides TaxID=1839 RepID=UPI0015EC99C4|nr:MULTISPECIES: hypothetical protein [unclassified Nocardioides]MBA2952572.1 hypothetical protein [Nocardioides sp. CGMCC 1.13656]